MTRIDTAAALCGFATAFAAIAIILPLLKKLKAKQEILTYVRLHAGKKGTPTMGGIGFIIAFALCGLLLAGTGKLSLLTVAVTAAYGGIGFLDDFIKIKYRRNLGLTAIQKTIAQIAVAAIVSVYVYLSGTLGGEIILPFSGREANIGFWIVPLGIFVFLGSCNGANLLDGLDGLASSVTASMSLCLCVLFSFQSAEALRCGLVSVSENYASASVLSAIMTGVLGAFLLFNCNPAAVFMGDTGSLALGAFAASVTLLTGNVLVLAFIGITYVVTVISVAAQVIYFKKTKGKRLLLMAPLHHHLQMKGLSETRISFVYSAITLIVGGIVIVLRCV